jgi:hypothetical protein
MGFAFVPGLVSGIAIFCRQFWAWYSSQFYLLLIIYSFGVGLVAEGPPPHWGFWLIGALHLASFLYLFFPKPRSFLRIGMRRALLSVPILLVGAAVDCHLIIFVAMRPT